MPRIRKKTSKRVSLHHRERIKHKVKETRKKRQKQAKKTPQQWKSKHPKDPGIPSAFPYKDEILAEVAEQRRLAAEEKQRRKDEKKAVKASAKVEGDESDADGAAFDGVRVFSAQRAKDGPSAVVESGEDEEEEEEAVPMLVNPDFPNLKAVLDAADVLVEVLDARDPLACRSAYLEEVAREMGKKVLLVLNKVDACPREAVEAWAGALRREYPTLLFRSATACLPGVSPTATKGKGKGKERADDAWGLDSVAALLQQWAVDKDGDIPLTIAVAGVTNVGKSSFVNSLLRKSTLQTYRLTSATTDSPTTTTHSQDVTLDLEGKQLRIIDTPGISWHPVEGASPEDTAQLRARDVLLRNRGHVERLKDSSPVLSELVSRATREDLMLLYNLPIFAEGNSNAFLAGVARTNSLIKKKGELDLAGAARIVLRDWSNGKFARFTLPESTSTPSDAPAIPESLAAIYAKDDDAILSKLPTRRELRKASGLVKLRTGTIDARKVVLDASYLVSSEDEGNEGDEEDAGTIDDADEVGLLDDEGSEGEDYVSDEDSEDEDEGGEDVDGEEDAEPKVSHPPRGKRKRVVAPSKAPARPAKRVAFAPEPKSTKQARSAAGAKGASKAKSGDKDKLVKPERKPTQKSPRAPVPKATKTKPVVAKIANSASSSKKSTAYPVPVKDGEKDGEMAYDFKQFF